MAGIGSFFDRDSGSNNLFENFNNKIENKNQFLMSGESGESVDSWSDKWDDSWDPPTAADEEKNKWNREWVRPKLPEQHKGFET